jgi:hypothetical protein
MIVEKNRKDAVMRDKVREEIKCFTNNFMI